MFVNTWTKLIYLMQIYFLIQNYWKKAYGHPILGKMACPLVKHMFDHLEDDTKSK